MWSPVRLYDDVTGKSYFFNAREIGDTGKEILFESDTGRFYLRGKIGGERTVIDYEDEKEIEDRFIRARYPEAAEAAGEDRIENYRELLRIGVLLHSYGQFDHLLDRHRMLFDSAIEGLLKASAPY